MCRSQILVNVLKITIASYFTNFVLYHVRIHFTPLTLIFLRGQIYYFRFVLCMEE